MCVYVYTKYYTKLKKSNNKKTWGRAKLRKLSEQGKATLNKKSKQASPYASKPLWNNSCLYSAEGKPQDWEHLTPWTVLGEPDTADSPSAGHLVQLVFPVRVTSSTAQAPKWLAYPQLQKRLEMSTHTAPMSVSLSARLQLASSVLLFVSQMVSSIITGLPQNGNSSTSQSNLLLHLLSAPLPRLIYTGMRFQTLKCN